MTVEFLLPYRGILTDERYYEPGERVTLPSRSAESLVARGLAVAREDLGHVPMKPREPSWLPDYRAGGDPVLDRLERIEDVLRGR